VDLTRRGFMAGAAALTASAVAADPVLSKVVLAAPLPRQKDVLEHHKYWELVRPHVLGHLSIDEMKMGLPGPFQELMSHWWVEGPKLHIPAYDLRVEDHDLTVTLRSGYKVQCGDKLWDAFYEKWLTEVCVPLYGKEIRTKNLGAAILTNIHLFRMAAKYALYK
jgi:hypothetical protein